MAVAAVVVVGEEEEEEEKNPRSTFTQYSVFRLMRTAMKSNVPIALWPRNTIPVRNEDDDDDDEDGEDEESGMNNTCFVLCYDVLSVIY